MPPGVCGPRRFQRLRPPEQRRLLSRSVKPQRRPTRTTTIPAAVQRVRDRKRPPERNRSLPARLERNGTLVVSLENYGGTHQLDRPRLERRVPEARPVPRTIPRATPRESSLERAGITGK